MDEAIIRLNMLLLLLNVDLVKVCCVGAAATFPMAESSFFRLSIRSSVRSLLITTMGSLWVASICSLRFLFRRSEITANPIKPRTHMIIQPSRNRSPHSPFHAILLEAVEGISAVEADSSVARTSTILHAFNNFTKR